MLPMEGINELLRQAERPFNIVEEFAALNAKRKVLLCDQLFTQPRKVFHGTVKLLWPEAQLADMKKLEKFLVALKRGAA